MGEGPLSAIVRFCIIASRSSHVLPLPIGRDGLYMAADFIAGVGKQGCRHEVAPDCIESRGQGLPLCGFHLLNCRESPISDYSISLSNQKNIKACADLDL